MNIPKAFWKTQLQDSIADKFKSLISTEWLSFPGQDVDQIDDEFPILLTSLKADIVAESQMFFEEPWFNIEYAEREDETDRLYRQYCSAISEDRGSHGVDMDVFFKLNRETMYDDFPDAWDSPVSYELGERVHLWIEAERTWFLGVFQEDKELPIELRFGCFGGQDMLKLSDHMNAFSAN